jgi:hypothetical protein
MESLTAERDMLLEKVNTNDQRNEAIDEMERAKEISDK